VQGFCRKYFTARERNPLQSPVLTGKAPVKGGKKSISDLEKADQQATAFPSLEEGGCREDSNLN